MIPNSYFASFTMANISKPNLSLQTIRSVSMWEIMILYFSHSVKLINSPNIPPTRVSIKCSSSSKMAESSNLE